MGWILRDTYAICMRYVWSEVGREIHPGTEV